MGLQYIKKYLLKGTQEKIPDTMVETVLCFHPHCTTKRRGIKPEEELCSKPVSPAEIGTYGKKIKAVSCQLKVLNDTGRQGVIVRETLNVILNECEGSMTVMRKNGVNRDIRKTVHII